MSVNCFLSVVSPSWWDEVVGFVSSDPAPDVDAVRAFFVRAGRPFPEDYLEPMESGGDRLGSGAWAGCFRDLLESEPDGIYSGFWYGDLRRRHVASLRQVIATVPPLGSLAPIASLSLEPALAIPARCDDPGLPMLAWAASTLDLDTEALRPFLERSAFDPWVAKPHVSSWQRVTGGARPVGMRLRSFLGDPMSFPYWERFLGTCLQAAETRQHLLFTQS